MIVDANLLLYAVDIDSHEHSRARFPEVRWHNPLRAT